MFFIASTIGNLQGQSHQIKVNSVRNKRNVKPKKKKIN